VRSIPSGEYGTRFDWAMVVIRPRWFSGRAVVMAVHGMSVRKRRELEVALRAQPWIREVAAVERR